MHAIWIEVSAPQWLATQAGQLRTTEGTIPLDTSFDQLFDLMFDGDMIGGAGHFEAHNRPTHLTLFADAVGAVTDTVQPLVLPTGVTVPNGALEVDSSLVFVEFGVGYRLGPWKIDRRGTRNFWAEPIVGGRYTKLEIDFESRVNGMPVGEQGNDLDWVDPFIGVRWMLDVFPSLALTFRGDIGGFDTGSDLAWSLVSTLVYRLPWTLWDARMFFLTGYRVIDLEYDDSSGGAESRLDVNFRGPLVGLGATY